MKVFIEIPGDHSVGIDDGQVVIDFGEADIPSDIEDRQILRKLLNDAFSDYFAQKIGVLFEDECPDCGNILVKNKCINKNCPQNF